VSFILSSDHTFLMIKNLIWDLDGTLFDTYPAFTQAFVSALAGYGHFIDQTYVLRMARIGLGHCATKLATRYDLAEEDIMQAFQAKYSRIDFKKQLLMPGALDVCKFILSKSGANVILTHRGKKSTLALLRTHGVQHLFQDIITGDDGFPRKPNSAGMEAIMQRNNLVEDDSLVIGDRELDAEAGRLAGVRTCILGDEGRNIMSTYHVSNLHELYEVLLVENAE
jgi:phosphoglycolate phosphatase-like HAD superfamily hydrolase